jgi:predicted DNA-binding protein
MKLTIKPKVEKTDQYNMRMPISLKQRLTALATRADAHATDLNATIVAMIEQLATELDERFDAEDKAAGTSPSTNPNKLLGRSTSINGADPERA